MGAPLPGFDPAISPYGAGGSTPSAQFSGALPPTSPPSSSSMEDMLILKKMLEGEKPKEEKHHKVLKWVLGTGAVIGGLTLAFLTGRRFGP